MAPAPTSSILAAFPLLLPEYLTEHTDHIVVSEAQLTTGNGFIGGSHSCEAEAVHIPVGLKQRRSQDPGAGPP